MTTLSSNSSYLPAVENPFVTMELKDNDVLLGRGTGPNTWIGNLMFRDLVHSQVEAYNSNAHNDHGEQHSVIKNIISKVHERGGRFPRKLALSKKNKQDLLSSAGFAGVGPSCSGSNKTESIYEIVTDMKILICKTKQAMRYSKDSKNSKVLEVSSGTPARRQHVVEEAASLQAALPLLKSKQNSPHHQGSIASSPSTNPFCSMEDTLKSSKPIREDSRPIREDSSAAGAVATYAAAAKSMISRLHSPYNGYGMIDSNTLLSPSRSVPASSFGSLDATSVARLQTTDPILGLVTANLNRRSFSNANHTTSNRMLSDESLLQYILRAKLRREVEATRLLTEQNKAAQSIRESALLLEGLRRGSTRSSATSSQESRIFQSIPMNSYI